MDVAGENAQRLFDAGEASSFDALQWSPGGSRILDGRVLVAGRASYKRDMRLRHFWLLSILFSISTFSKAAIDPSWTTPIAPFQMGVCAILCKRRSWLMPRWSGQVRFCLLPLCPG
jgi:hypothetical protein